MSAHGAVEFEISPGALWMHGLAPCPIAAGRGEELRANSNPGYQLTSALPDAWYSLS